MSAGRQDDAASRGGGRGRLRATVGLRLAWPAVGLVLLLLFNAFRDDGFLRLVVVDGHLHGPLLSILAQAAKIMLVAVGMTLVIATGGVDLSVGSVMAICGATAATLAASGMAGPLALAAGLAAGFGVGLLNGALVASLR
ncbi:MAG TPA: hypothetical protein VMN39_07885, partial [Longimicrobiaceae bacterium]|nr:hypothetical protein [Longimicrobiaceae bacterium]